VGKQGKGAKEEKGERKEEKTKMRVGKKGRCRGENRMNVDKERREEVWRLRGRQEEKKGEEKKKQQSDGKKRKIEK
jgi:hypothetical protein